MVSTHSHQLGSSHASHTPLRCRQELNQIKCQRDNVENALQIAYKVRRLPPIPTRCQSPFLPNAVPSAERSLSRGPNPHACAQEAKAEKEEHNSLIKVRQNHSYSAFLSARVHVFTLWC